jgi:hypothetical protein
VDYECEQCVRDADCSGETPICDTGELECVACVDDGDCSGDTPYCRDKEACVTCLEDEQCEEGQVCENGDCISEE